MNHTPAEERLLALLESQHQFPCAFPIKILFKSADGRAARVVADIAATTGVRVAGVPTERASSKGKYTAVTAALQVGAPEQIIEVYRHLATVEEIVGYF